MRTHWHSPSCRSTRGSTGCLLPLAGCATSSYGIRVTYSPKVFIPLTMLCRDVCHYCTFARPPKRGERAYLTVDEAVEIARQGAEAGCREALFTLGDKPELRYRAAREELASLGFETTAAYLAHVAGEVLRQTGLLPHANPGILDDDELLALREVCASQGIMLETTSERISQRGGAHFGSPDKLPSRAHRCDRPCRAAADPVHERHPDRHRRDPARARRGADRAARPAPRARAPAGDHRPELPRQGRHEDGRRGGAHARRITSGRSRSHGSCCRPRSRCRRPRTSSGDEFPALLGAGIDDFGGISPVTPDHVNPEAPWPEVARLEAACAAAGLTLLPRLAGLPGVPRRSRDVALPGHARRGARRLGRPRARAPRALDDRHRARAAARLAGGPAPAARRRRLPGLRARARARRDAGAARRGRRHGPALGARARDRAARRARPTAAASSEPATA